MAATTLRDRLYDYIRYADDKKVKAIYTMVEDEINQKYDPWEDPEYVKMLDKRVDDIKTGKVKGVSWEEVKGKFLLSKKK
ncbi:addiction module protein [Pedobacter heparinus]|uniref:addiction module protein n=1 Tax=Pedobacter heparinus TaxID=984 RepID=UPI00292E62E3|nr:addiction module protein [Pedobacter heparinus]